MATEEQVDAAASELAARLNGLLERIPQPMRADGRPTAPKQRSDKRRTPWDCVLCYKPIYEDQKIRQTPMSRKWVHSACWGTDVAGGPEQGKPDKGSACCGEGSDPSEAKEKT